MLACCEPKITLLDRFFEFAVCPAGNKKGAGSYGSRIEFSYRMDRETFRETYSREAFLGCINFPIRILAGLHGVEISRTPLIGSKVRIADERDLRAPQRKSGDSFLPPVSYNSEWLRVNRPPFCLAQLDQCVALFACAQLDRRRQSGRINHHASIGQRLVIDPRTVFRDQALGLFA